MSSSQAYQGNRWNDLHIWCDFVEGKLGAKDRIDFENELRKSEELASKVEGVKYFFDGEKVDRRALENFLSQAKTQQENLITQHYAKKNAGGNISFQRMAIAAIILVLFGLGISFLWLRPTPLSPQLIAQQNLAIPYEFPLQDVRGTNPQNERTDWINAYRQKDYESCIALLSNLKERNEQQAYALALSYLYSENHAKARTYLEKVLAQENINSLYTDQARWYLALSFLDKGELSQAEEYLSLIKQEGEAHFKYEEAMHILGALKN